MGGNDEPENLIELTVEEHAEAHHILYENHGQWQDYLAWQGLLNLISSQECAKISIIEGAKEGNKRRREKYGLLLKTDPNYVPLHKRASGYDKDVDGRKIRSKRYWFNDGINEGQFALDNYPEGWIRGRPRRSYDGGDIGNRSA